MSTAAFGGIKQEIPTSTLAQVENLPSVPLPSTQQPEGHAQSSLSVLSLPPLATPVLDPMAVAQPLTMSETIPYPLAQPPDARPPSYATPPSPMPSRHTRPQPIRTLTEPAKFPQLQDFQNPPGYEFTPELTPLSSSGNPQNFVSAPPQILPSSLDRAREAFSLFIQFLMQAEIPSTPGATGPRMFVSPADMSARFDTFMESYYGALSVIDPQRNMRKRHRQSNGTENHISPKQIKAATGYFDILARPQPTQVSSSPIIPLSNDHQMHSLSSTASSLHQTQATSTTLSMFTGHPLVSAPPVGAINSVTPPRPPQSATSTDSRHLIQPFTPMSPPDVLKNGIIASQPPPVSNALGSDPTSPALGPQDPALTLAQEGMMASVATSVHSQPPSPRLFTNNVDLEMVRPSLSQPLPQQPPSDALNVLETINSQVSQQAFMPPVPATNGVRTTRPRSSSAATLAQVPAGLEMSKQLSFSHAPTYGYRGHHNKSISVDAAYDCTMASEQNMFMAPRMNGQHNDSMASISVPNSPQQTLEFAEDPYVVNGIGDALRERMDMVLFDLLQTLCFDMDASDSAGEKIHQTQMPKKIARLEETADFRPFKFRIQAFTNRFIEELAANPATKGLDIPQKSVKQYLWNQPYICRYSEGGKKSKSKGNHIWTIEARKVSDAPWEFRPFERRIVTPACKNVRTGIRWTYEPKIFDPQAPQLQAEFTSSALPDWLSWRSKIVDSKNVVYLDGIPPVNATFPVSISIAAVWEDDGKPAKLETTFDLNLEKSNSSATARGQAFQAGVFATDVKI